MIYNAVNNQSANVVVSSSPSDTPALFGIDPSSGLLCSNTPDDLTALFADQPDSFGTVSFDSAAIRQGDPSYLNTGVTATINSDLSLSLINSQNGANQTLSCFGYLALMLGGSLGCGPVTLFAAPIAGVPTTTTTTTIYATTTVTPPIPTGTCTSFTLLAYANNGQIDGLYAIAPQQSTMQFTSDSSAATTFTLDGNSYLSAGGYYANVNQNVNTDDTYNSKVFFNTPASITSSGSHEVYMTCAIGGRGAFSCNTGYADTFEVDGTTLFFAPAAQMTYSTLRFTVDTINYQAPCPSSS